MKDRELIALKKEIDQSKESLSELKGKKKMVMENLKTNFGCSSIKQAKKKLAEMQESITGLEKKKQKAIEELEENYEF